MVPFFLLMFVPGTMAVESKTHEELTGPAANLVLHTPGELVKVAPNQQRFEDTEESVQELLNIFEEHLRAVEKKVEEFSKQLDLLKSRLADLEKPEQKEKPPAPTKAAS